MIIGLIIYCITNIANIGEKSIIMFLPIDDLNCNLLNGSNMGSVTVITNRDIGLLIFSILNKDSITLIKMSQFTISKK